MLDGVDIQNELAKETIVFMMKIISHKIETCKSTVGYITVDTEEVRNAMTVLRDAINLLAFATKTANAALEIINHKPDPITAQETDTAEEEVVTIASVTHPSNGRLQIPNCELYSSAKIIEREKDDSDSSNSDEESSNSDEGYSNSDEDDRAIQ